MPGTNADVVGLSMKMFCEETYYGFVRLPVYRRFFDRHLIDEELRCRTEPEGRLRELLDLLIS